ncbi:calcium-binding protein [Allorhodopirellula heiligendammensis]|uniref:calcium-binding protein n=1 Tax=Allorhodopirellula heiligendammensis TaxID=2714739 RepID=UPI00265F861F|nr:calcium-binding protein [Allorhodopirellula heiligendammensis]
MEKLVKRELLAADLGIVDEGLQSGFLQELQDSINHDILSTPAPLVGSALAGEINAVQAQTQTSHSNQWFSHFENEFAFLDLDSDATVAEVKSQLADVLGVSLDSVQVTGNDGDSEIRFDITLVDSISREAAVALDLIGADPEIELLLGTEGQVDLDLAVQYQLTFGVIEDSDGTSSFYFDTEAADELIIDYTATVREDFDSGKGRVGVFIADFSESPNHESQFSGTYTIDVRQAAAGGVAVDGTLVGSGAVHLDIDASFFPNINLNTDLINLGVTAEGRVEYDTQLVFADGENDNSGNAVTVGLDEVAIDLGQIYSDFIDPFVRKLQDQLRPAAPAIGFLTEPIPVISDLYEMLGEAPVTALSLAGVEPDDPASIAIHAVDAILGYDGFGLNSENIQSLFDIEFAKVDFDPEAIRDLADEAGKNIRDLKEGLLGLDLSNTLATPEGQAEFERSMEWGTDFGGAFDLPFLTDPEILAGFLMGDTSGELVTFEVSAGLEFEAGVSIPIAPLLNLAQLNAGLSVELGLELAAGYDALGIAQLASVADFSSEAALEQSLEDNQDLLISGFYMDDRNDLAGVVGEGENSDHDAPEVSLTVIATGGISAGLDAKVVKATIGGEIFLAGTLELDLNDLPDPDVGVEHWEDVLSPLWTPSFLDSPDQWNYDGRIRAAELVTIVNENPLAVANVNGSLAAGLSASVTVETFGFTVFDKTWELARVTLLDGTLFESDDAELLLNANQSQLGQVVDGELQLFMGDTASLRTDARPDVADETFTIRSLGQSDGGGETLLAVFEADGESYLRIFEGVTRIVGAGGEGNDQVTVLDGVTSDVTLDGEGGDDTFFVDTTGVATLRGGDGQDRLIGGAGNDTLIGGDGDDYLEGFGGNDLLIAGLGSDTLYGGAGNDSLFGDGGEDDLDGGVGDDSLEGGNDDDILRGAEGSDSINGGTGDDTIRFGLLLNDPDSIDVLHGGANFDKVEIYGTEESDELTLESLADTPGTFRVSSDLANFQFRLPTNALQRDIEEVRVSGLGGDDLVSVIGELNVGTVVVDGGEGNDTISGSDGRDLLLGGGGTDTILGNGGDDVIHGGEAADAIFGGEGQDSIYGDAGDDVIDGGAGFDVIYGGEDDDVIHAGIGLAGGVIYGDAGNDTLFGGHGDDEIHGGVGDDTLAGGGGDDYLRGGEGNDSLAGGVGIDFVQGDSGDDILFAVVDPALHSSDLADSQINDLIAETQTAQDLASQTDALHSLLLEFAMGGLTNSQQNDLKDALEGLKLRVNELEQDRIDATLVQLISPESEIGNPTVINTLMGGTGNDQLFGSIFSDALFGGEGHDSFEGGGGSDTGDSVEAEIELRDELNNLVLTASQENGILEIRATEGRDLLNISQSDRMVSVKIGAQEFLFSPVDDRAFSEIRILGLGGDDYIKATGTFDSLLRLEGGQGNDILNGSGSGDILDGGDGDDLLLGHGGDDELHGGSGDDRLQGGEGDDSLIGGQGIDRLSGDDGNDELFADDGSVDWISALEQQTPSDRASGLAFSIKRWSIWSAIDPNDLNSVTEPVLLESLNGGAGDDVLLGSDLDDSLIGGSGNDQILHTTGDDHVFGGLGDDRYTYRFGDASERIELSLNESGNIVVRRQDLSQSASTAIELVHPQGSEIESIGVEALGGDDQIHVEFGNNALIDLHLDGGAGNDLFHIGKAPVNVTVMGGVGDGDHAFFETGDASPDLVPSDSLLKGQADYAFAGLEILTLKGDSRSNTLDGRGFTGETHLFGKAGDDLLLIGNGGGTADGGSDHDSVQIHGTSIDLDGNHVVHSSQNIFSAGTNLVDVESVSLHGNDGDNSLMVLHRNNVQVFAGGGDDLIIFAGQNHEIWGGDGDDQIMSLDSEWVPQNNVIWGGSGNDIITGSIGVDIIHGGDGADLIRGEGGNDIIEGGSGNNELHGGDGDDEIRGGEHVDLIFGDRGNDRIWGLDGNDILHGGDGDDYIRGAYGDDSIYGGDGNDSLYGDSGTDHIWAENGDDWVYGGKDGTRDYLDGGSGHDRVTQYYYKYGFLKLKKRWQEEHSGFEEESRINYKW